jgi:hypothetical protein
VRCADGYDGGTAGCRPWFNLAAHQREEPATSYPLFARTDFQARGASLSIERLRSEAWSPLEDNAWAPRPPPHGAPPRVSRFWQRFSRK